MLSASAIRKQLRYESLPLTKSLELDRDRIDCAFQALEPIGRWTGRRIIEQTCALENSALPLSPLVHRARLIDCGQHEQHESAA